MNLGLEDRIYLEESVEDIQRYVERLSEESEILEVLRVLESIISLSEELKLQLVDELAYELEYSME